MAVSQRTEQSVGEEEKSKKKSPTKGRRYSKEHHSVISATHTNSNGTGIRKRTEAIEHQVVRSNKICRSPTLKPPDNFRSLDVVPRVKDILSNLEPFLRPNLVQGKYPDADTYLDTQFRLLHEDFIYPLHVGITSCRNQLPSKNRKIEVENVHLYYDVVVTKLTGWRMYNIEFSTKGLEQVRWEESKRLIYGSLVCLSADNFQSILLFVVMRGDGENGKISARFEGGNLHHLQNKKMFIMAESCAYFEAYRNTLTALQTITSDTFPLKKYILECSNTVEVPDYLVKVKKPMYDLNCVPTAKEHVDRNMAQVSILDEQNRPSATKLGFDPSQCAALYAALTRKVAIIQGPPGTGKTFIGLKIVEVLLNNSHHWKNRSKNPILIICYTNNALDQFLVGIKRFNKNIVRIGGQSKCDELEPYELNALKGQLKKKGIDGNQICREADVIGMTTTGAAKRRILLEDVKPKIVIIEEAAEALEAHIVAALPISCQHLILIGDHKQLRPTTAFHLAKGYQMDVSLFERLVLNNMAYCRLDVQHRMRPEVVRLIVPFIYKGLRNSDSVNYYPVVKGITRNVFFLTHNKKEKIDQTGKSYLNAHEADLAFALTRHFIKQGYKTDQITILTTYSGQLNHFNRKRLLKNHEFIEGVRIATVDSFQGEENDIIILSLVRNNEAGTIGFLKIENRICVALSRAKQGFYLLGNMDALKIKSKLWKNIANILRVNEELGSQFLLKCEVHSTIAKVLKIGQFPPEGGCQKRCKSLMPCGHICPKYCHPVDRDHRQYLCKNLVRKTLPCSHSLMMECHKDPEMEYCRVKRIKVIIQCGHKLEVECSKTPILADCTEDHKVKMDNTDDAKLVSQFLALNLNMSYLNFIDGSD